MDIASFLKRNVEPHVNALRDSAVTLQREYEAAMRQVASLQTLLDNERCKVRVETG